jgi:hypothetical protein
VLSVSSVRIVSPLLSLTLFLTAHLSPHLSTTNRGVAGFELHRRVQGGSVHGQGHVRSVSSSFPRSPSFPRSFFSFPSSSNPSLLTATATSTTRTWTTPFGVTAGLTSSPYVLLGLCLFSPPRANLAFSSQHDFNAAQVTPEWHAWLSHIRHLPPTEDPVVLSAAKPWQIVRFLPIISPSQVLILVSFTAPLREPHRNSRRLQVVQHRQAQGRLVGAYRRSPVVDFRFSLPFFLIIFVGGV